MYQLSTDYQQLSVQTVNRGKLKHFKLVKRLRAKHTKYDSE